MGKIIRQLVKFKATFISYFPSFSHRATSMNGLDLVNGKGGPQSIEILANQVRSVETNMAETGEHTMEDAVEYRLFPAIPEDLPSAQVSRYLEEQLDTYIAHLSQVLVDYIWQKSPFNLKVIPAKVAGLGPPHLWGRTCFGDNVEDEWFIVYLISQLTQEFDGLVAKIGDVDGEFLLIEAANSLPKWVNPDTAVNRVYLYEGKIHLVGYPQKPSDVGLLPAGKADVQEAVKAVRDIRANTVGSERIQRDIQRRIGDYPEKRHLCEHRAHCYLPANLAAVLDHSPYLIAPIVEAFYLRDPLDLQACTIMTNFQPGTRVTREVRFTKVLYAQLMKQRFAPDKRAGWNIPAASNDKFKSYDLGVKLAHGAEILCSKCGDISNNPDEAEHISRHDERWKRLQAALRQRGFFRDEKIGSKLYMKLLNDAKRYFFSTLSTDHSTGPEAGKKILRLLGQVTYDIEDMRRQGENLPPPDDDSWMSLTAEQLDEMLNKAAGPRSPGMPQSNSFDMGAMTDSMHAFMGSMSSHEGVEAPKQGDDAEVQFDSNSFMQSLQKTFEFEEDSASSSDMGSEYGSEDEIELPPRRGPFPYGGGKGLPAGDDILGMQEYLRQMDKELAGTDVGKGFERYPAHNRKTGASSGTSSQGSEGSDKSSNASRESPRKIPAPRATIAEDDIDELDDDFQPVNVDLNLVKNLLESYNSEEGAAGPTSNIMNSMGVKLPRDVGM